MLIAWLITALAIAGIVGGVIGHVHVPSAPLAAGGGGLLVGICIFWLLPEVVPITGLLRALLLIAAVCGLLLLVDRTVGHRFVIPLLAATALHSFLDGWALRTLAIRPLETIAVPIGLGLHKIPEGFALGWIARRWVSKAVTAAALASAVELMTPLGAFVQPFADRGGFAMFGPLWTALVLSVVGGSFLFLGLHAVVPERRKARVVTIFLATFAVVGFLTLFRSAV